MITLVIFGREEDMKAVLVKVAPCVTGIGAQMLVSV
ncbi:unnamed protein product, partial [marine sediment metagenome]